MSSTILMVIMICVGLAIGIVGMVIVGRRAYRLSKTMQQMDRNRIQDVSRRIQELTPRIEQTAAKQRDLAEKMKELEIANKRLTYLREQFDAATGRHFKAGPDRPGKPAPMVVTTRLRRDLSSLDLSTGTATNERSHP